MNRSKKLYLVMMDTDGTFQDWKPADAPVVTLLIEDGVLSGEMDARDVFERYFRPALAQLQHDWDVEQSVKAGSIVG